LSQGRDKVAVIVAAFLAGTLVAQQVAAKAARDALFLAAFRVTSLPAMMVTSAALSALAAIVFARVARGRAPVGSLGLGLAAFAALSLAGGFLGESWPRLVAGGFYLQTALFGAVLLSAFWSVVNERFDPYTARHAVARIASGATLGGVVGGGATLLAARYVRATDVLLALAAASLLCLVASRWLRDPSSRTSEPPGHPQELAFGVGLFRRRPYLQDLALLVGLGSLVEALLDYAFKFEASARYSGGEALFRFFSTYAAATAFVTFLAQTLLSPSALARLGLGGAIALQPGGVFLFSLLGMIQPGFLTATLARGGAAVFHDSVFRSAYELLYTPLPPKLKRASKAVVDVAVDRLGTIVGSLLTMAAAGVLVRPTAPLLALAAGLAFLAASLCRRLHRGYVMALEASLRSGAVKLEPEDVVDGTTLAVSRSALGLDRKALLAEIHALRGEGESSAEEAPAEEAPPREDPFLRSVADLRSGSPDRIRAALSRPEGLEPALVAHMIPLLARRDVASEVGRALRPLAPQVTGQLVDALVDPRMEPASKRRVARVLKGSPTPRAVEGLLLGLQDRAGSVRVECGRALAAIKAARPDLAVPQDRVFDAVLRELEAARPDGGSPSLAHGVLDHVFALLALVLEAEPVLISLQALRGESGALRGTALEYLENVLPRPVKDALWPGLGVASTGTRAPRAAQEMEDELLRSWAGTDVGALRRSLLRPGRRPVGDD
jgi:hypothetical protein